MSVDVQYFRTMLQCQVSQLVRVVGVSHMRNVLKWIIRNTVLTRDHLISDIQLHLITPQCPLWMSKPDLCPFPDPYWAFFWPGGQALARYICDTPGFLDGKSVLDLGCGCGAATVAALKYHRVAKVIANDIDEVALTATWLNCKRNLVDIQALRTTSVDLIASKEATDCQVILIGDLFYDSQFGSQLLTWLQSRLKSDPNLIILIGDPGRHALPATCQLTCVKEYPLPAYITREHYGYSSAKVLQLQI